VNEKVRWLRSNGSNTVTVQTSFYVSTLLHYFLLYVLLLLNAIVAPLSIQCGCRNRPGEEITSPFSERVPVHSILPCLDFNYIFYRSLLLHAYMVCSSFRSLKYMIFPLLDLTPLLATIGMAGRPAEPERVYRTTGGRCALEDQRTGRQRRLLPRYPHPCRR